MQTIIDGVERFQSAVYPKMAARFRALADGQKPEALFVTCSDSRVDPSLITQTAPGEIFVIRNAGNLIPHWGEESSIDASVEYAVAVLEVGHVIVCGHSGCGAVGGALDPSGLDVVPSVKHWVARASHCVEATAHLHGPERLPAAVEANVRAQLDNLRSHPSVATALAAGKVQLHGWVYDIATGEVIDLAERKVAA